MVEPVLHVSNMVPGHEQEGPSRLLDSLGPGEIDLDGCRGVLLNHHLGSERLNARLECVVALARGTAIEDPHLESRPFEQSSRVGQVERERHVE